ncbi:hypothetical protein HYY27_00715, partial [bacterium]|nr:hypothetical protein [bacterium]
AGQLARIAQQEGIEIPEEALFLIARRADGAMRDAQSLLDQVVAFAGTSVTAEAVREALGVLDQDLFFRATDAVLAKDRVAGLNLIEELIGQGGDVGEFARGLLEHLRNLLVCKIQGGDTGLDLSEADRLRYRTHAEPFPEQDLQRMIQIVSDLDRDIGDVIQPRLHLEIALLKLIAMEPVVSIDDLLDRLDRLEERLRGRLAAPESAPAPSRPSPALPEPSNRPHAQADEPPANQPLASAEPPSRVPPARGEENASAPSPVPPASPGPVSLEIVRQKWDEIVGRVKAESISLGAHLDHGTPRAVADEILRVGFPARAAFSASHIRRKKREFEDIAARVLGTRLRVECILEGSDAEPQPSQNPGEEQEAEQETKTEVAPSVQTVLQIFDGEILRR